MVDERAILVGDVDGAVGGDPDALRIQSVTLDLGIRAESSTEPGELHTLCVLQQRSADVAGTDGRVRLRTRDRAAATHIDVEDLIPVVIAGRVVNRRPARIGHLVWTTIGEEEVSRIESGVRNARPEAAQRILTRDAILEDRRSQSCKVASVPAKGDIADERDEGTSAANR